MSSYSSLCWLSLDTLSSLGFSNILSILRLQGLGTWIGINGWALWGVVRHAPEFISNVLYLCSFRDRLLSDSQSEHQYPCLPTINHSDLSPSCPALHCCYWSSGNRLVIITPSQTAHEASHSLAAAYLSSCVSSSAAECGTRLTLLCLCTCNPSCLGCPPSLLPPGEPPLIL